GGFRPQNLLQELVLGHDLLGRPPREPDPGLRTARPALDEGGEIAPRGVEDADRAADDVFDESLLVGQGADREAGVVEGLEEKKLVLSLEVAGRPFHHFVAARTFSRRSWATASSASFEGAQLGFHFRLASRSFSAPSRSPCRARTRASCARPS